MGFGLIFIAWMYMRYFPWMPLGATAIAVAIYFILKRYVKAADRPAFLKEVQLDAGPIAFGSWCVLMFFGFMLLLHLYPFH